MKSGQKPVRQLVSRIFMAAVLALMIPLGSTFAMTGYNTGVAAGFSYSDDNYSFLASYGAWTNLAPYGQVWLPSQAAGWRPFLNGNWIWTSDGWAWSSNEPFGWLVYHYGHWNYRQDVGWYWIPGDVWSPAAVVWSSVGDYVYWAPAPPVGVYWPRPWDISPFGFNVWFGVRLRDFDRDDIFRFGVHRFPRRDEIFREHIFNGPPNIVLAQQFSDHFIFTHRIDRDRDFRDRGFRDRDFRDRGFQDRNFQNRDFRDRNFGNRNFRNRDFQNRDFRPNHDFNRMNSRFDRHRGFHERQNAPNGEANTPWGSPPRPLGHINNSQGNTPWGSPPQPLGHIDNRDFQHGAVSQGRQGHFENRGGSQGHSEQGHHEGNGGEHHGGGNGMGHAGRGRGR